MSYKHKPSVVEKIAEALHIIPNLHNVEDPKLPRLTEPGHLTSYPPPEQWDNWTEFEPKGWGRKETKNYTIVPTTCFNCESACGLLSWVQPIQPQMQKQLFI